MDKPIKPDWLKRFNPNINPITFVREIFSTEITDKFVISIEGKQYACIVQDDMDCQYDILHIYEFVEDKEHVRKLKEYKDYYEQMELYNKYRRELEKSKKEKELYEKLKKKYEKA